MCHITMPKPTVRSMRPAIIGRVAASASRATIDLSARIERALSQVGNVSGSRIENKTIKASVRKGKPVDRRQPHDRFAQRDSPASSDRVGSSAFDLMDCMRASSRDIGGGGGSRCAERRMLAEAAASRFSTDRSSAPSSATTRPRSKISARWQTLATSSKSVDTMMMAAPCLERDVEETIDFRLGADVDAGGRILEDVDLRVEVQPAPDHHLLLVAARQELDRQRRIVRPQSDAARRAPSRPGFRGPGEHERKQAQARRDRIEEQVLAHRQIRHDRFADPVGADQIDALRHRLARR